MKKTILLFIGLLAVTSSYASNWDHIYMGTNFGATISNYDVKFSGRGSVGATSYPTASKALSNEKVTSGNAQVTWGLGHTFGRFYLGGNLLLQLGMNQDKTFTATQTSGANSTTVRQQIDPNAFSFGVNFQPGIVLSPKTLLYSEVGILLQSVSIRTETRLATSTNFYGAAIDKSFWAKGLQYGIGLRYQLNDQMTIKGSFVMTSFINNDKVLGSMTSPIISATNTSYVYSFTKLKSEQMFLIGVDYSF